MQAQGQNPDCCTCWWWQWGAGGGGGRGCSLCFGVCGLTLQVHPLNAYGLCTLLELLRC